MQPRVESGDLLSSELLEQAIESFHEFHVLQPRSQAVAHESDDFVWQ